MKSPAQFCKDHKIDTRKKWYISIFAGIIFLIIVLPLTFRLTNSLLSPVGIKTWENGRPTTLGIIIHAIVYVLVTRFSMG